MTDQEEKDILLIEAYHQGKLSIEDREAFEERRKNDPSFDTKAEDYITIMDQVKMKGARDFREKLQTWEASHQTNTRSIWSSVALKYAAAVALVVLGISTWWLWLDTAPSHETLYAEYFSPYDDIVSARSDNSDSLFTAAIHAYQKQQYTNAIPIFKKYIAQHPSSSFAKLYLSISYMAEEDFTNAIKLLQYLKMKSSGLMLELSQWYLALAYLGQNEQNKASEMLEQIATSDHIYRDKAQSLLADME